MNNMIYLAINFNASVIFTQQQWKGIIQAEFLYYLGNVEVDKEFYLNIMPKGSFKSSKCPMTDISWDNCTKFIKRLNDITQKEFRLPTEAEWEYAARGGIRAEPFMYSGGDILDDVAVFSGNNNVEPMPVGSKKPNSLGLYDMSGNVWEFCLDRYGPYNINDQINPINLFGNKYVTRGGAWNTTEQYCRITNRNCVDNFKSNNNLGFRLVLMP